MIIVDPDPVTVFSMADNRIAEQLIDLLVTSPVVVLEDCVLREIMEKRPDSLIGEARVEFVDISPAK